MQDTLVDILTLLMYSEDQLVHRSLIEERLASHMSPSTADHLMAYINAIPIPLAQESRTKVERLVNRIRAKTVRRSQRRRGVRTLDMALGELEGLIRELRQHNRRAAEELLLDLRLNLSHVPKQDERSYTNHLDGSVLPALAVPKPLRDNILRSVGEVISLGTDSSRAKVDDAIEALNLRLL